MSRKISAGFVAPLLAALVLLLATSASAVSITYQLEQGSEGGFGFSGLHDADDLTPMSGAHLGDVNGSLTFDYDATGNTYMLLSSTVSLDSTDYSFQIMNGVINGDGSGYLGFTMEGSGAYAQRGRIVYAPGPVCCGLTGPNWMTPDKLRLWGAVDIEPSDGIQGAPKRFGMDLGGSAVPEPSAAMVFGIGMLVFGSAVRKRSR